MSGSGAIKHSASRASLNHRGHREHRARHEEIEHDAAEQSWSGILFTQIARRDDTHTSLFIKILCAVLCSLWLTLSGHVFDGKRTGRVTLRSGCP